MILIWMSLHHVLGTFGAINNLKPKPRPKLNSNSWSGYEVGPWVLVGQLARRGLLDPGPRPAKPRVHIPLHRDLAGAPSHKHQGRGCGGLAAACPGEPAVRHLD